MSTDPSKRTNCAHYSRKCSLVAPCCGKSYQCRFCHDENESHMLDRSMVDKVECNICSKVQLVSQNCQSCSTEFGKYFCRVCRLYDDVDKGQFHCDGCGLCRVGGAENYIHCDKCQMCLPKMEHTCIQESSRRDCPICLEDIHSSRIVSQVPPCGHLIHKPCYENLVKSGFYACPTCGRSMVPMKEIWEKLEEEIERTPMPQDFRNLYCMIHCKDCLKESESRYHSLGQKCHECGSFNTVRKTNLMP